MMFAACKKEQTLSGANNQSVLKAKPGDAIDAFFRQNREANTQTFQFDAKQGKEFTGEKGTIVNVRSGALRHLDGTPVYGPVVAKLLEVESAADALEYGFPTQSVWDEESQTGGAPIETAGSLELKIETPEGEPLTAEGDGVTIAVPADEIDPDMKVWEGTPSPDQPRDNNWKEQPDEEVGHIEHLGQQYYLINWEGRDRLNIDKLFSCPGAPTPFKVDLPSGFDKHNTEVYVLAEVCDNPGVKSVFSLDVYNPSPIWWSEHTPGGIPAGTNVYFVAVANVSGTLYYKIESATITGPSHFQHMTGMAPTTLSALTAAINAL